MLARKRRYEAGCMLISPPRLKRPFRYMKFKSSWLDDGWYNRSCPFACRRNETKVQLREPLSADSEHVHVRSRAKIAVERNISHGCWKRYLATIVICHSKDLRRHCSSFQASEITREMHSFDSSKSLPPSA